MLRNFVIYLLTLYDHFKNTEITSYQYYTQTWYYNVGYGARQRFLRWCCEHVIGHEVSATETGFWVTEGGIPMRDQWCRWCNQYMPVALSDKEVNASKFLSRRLQTLVRRVNA